MFSFRPSDVTVRPRQARKHSFYPPSRRIASDLLVLPRHAQTASPSHTIQTDEGSSFWDGVALGTQYARSLRQESLTPTVQDTLRCNGRPATHTQTAQMGSLGQSKLPPICTGLDHGTGKSNASQPASTFQLLMSKIPLTSPPTLELLPLEIRREVYRCIYKGYVSKDCIALMQVCRQFQREAADVFYSEMRMTTQFAVRPSARNKLFGILRTSDWIAGREHFATHLIRRLNLQVGLLDAKLFGSHKDLTNKLLKIVPRLSGLNDVHLRFLCNPDAEIWDRKVKHLERSYKQVVRFVLELFLGLVHLKRVALDYHSICEPSVPIAVFQKHRVLFTQVTTTAERASGLGNRISTRFKLLQTHDGVPG